MLTKTYEDINRFKLCGIILWLLPAKMWHITSYHH